MEWWIWRAEGAWNGFSLEVRLEVVLERRGGISFLMESISSRLEAQHELNYGRKAKHIHSDTLQSSSFDPCTREHGGVSSPPF